MPLHDWTTVEPGIFHAFHVAWTAAIQRALNDGLLPPGYYALAEQHAGRSIADVLTLHASPAAGLRPLPPLPDAGGGLAVAEAPPRVQRTAAIEPESIATRRRTLAVRHVSDHRIVAILEVVSPSNKDRPQSVDELADKVADALLRGVHALLIDLFPPGPHDPGGVHQAVRQRLERSDAPYALPPGQPLTLASYAAGPRIDAYLDHLAPGAALPDMPLFLRPDRYVNVPLDRTYADAYRGLPAYWRDVLDGREPKSS